MSHPERGLQRSKISSAPVLYITDKTKQSLIGRLGVGFFFCFQAFECFINLVAQQFDVLLLCVSVCVFDSLFLFFSVSDKPSVETNVVKTALEMTVEMTFQMTVSVAVELPCGCGNDRSAGC